MLRSIRIKEAEARAVELDDDVIMNRTWEEGGGGIYILRLLRLRDQWSLKQTK